MGCAGKRRRAIRACPGQPLGPFSRSAQSASLSSDRACPAPNCRVHQSKDQAIFEEIIQADACHRTTGVVGPFLLSLSWGFL